jgi:hypothetical protein
MGDFRQRKNDLLSLIEKDPDKSPERSMFYVNEFLKIFREESVWWAKFMALTSFLILPTTIAIVMFLAPQSAADSWLRQSASLVFVVLASLEILCLTLFLYNVWEATWLKKVTRPQTAFEKKEVPK